MEKNKRNERKRLIKNKLKDISHSKFTEMDYGSH